MNNYGVAVLAATSLIAGAFIATCALLDPTLHDVAEAAFGSLLG